MAFEFAGVVESNHNLARKRMFREAPNRLDFSFVYRYVECIGPHASLDLNCSLDVTWYNKNKNSRSDQQQGLGSRSFEPLSPVLITHIDYGKARATGSIFFEIDQKGHFSTFHLKINSGKLMLAKLDLGTYRNPRDREDDLLLELIDSGKLLRLRSNWLPVYINEVYSTNIVPAGDMIKESEELGSELCERLTARTASKISRDYRVRAWEPSTPEHNKEALSTAYGDIQLNAGNTQQILDSLARFHGVEQDSGAASNADTISLAFFQTAAFSKHVRSTASKQGLAVFGFSGVEDNIQPVVDLRALWHGSVTNKITLAQRRNLLATANEGTFRNHNLMGLVREKDKHSANKAGAGKSDSSVAQDDPAPDSTDPDRAEVSDLTLDLQFHACRALQRGYFLNSEPRFIEYWINMQVLGMGKELLLENAGTAIKSIRAAAQIDEPVLVVNMIGGLAHEFELEAKGLTLGSLYLTKYEAQVVNIDFSLTPTGEISIKLACAPDSASPPRLPKYASAILLTPIDTYMNAHSAVTSWLSDNDHPIVGIVPLISAAGVRPFGAHDWQADYLPVLRLVGDEAVLHPRLRR